MSPAKSTFTFDRVARIVFGVAIAAAILWLVYYLRGALLPFGVGCLIAYMAEPLVQRNIRITWLWRSLGPGLMALPGPGEVSRGGVGCVLSGLRTGGRTGGGGG